MNSGGSLEVILLWRRSRTNEPWELDQILMRDEAGTVSVHGSSKPMYYPDGPQRDFEYLWERHRDGSGGNGYTYEIEGYTLDRSQDLDRLIQERSQSSAFIPGSTDSLIPTSAPTPAEDRPRVPVLQPLDEHPPWTIPVRRRLHRRTPAPTWLDRTDDVTRQLLARAWGADPRWGWALPWVWQALSRPATLLRPPATPTVRSSVFDAAAYWVPALHLLRYGLGWTRPDQGLAAWLEADRPLDDPALTLLDQVWARDGQLEWLLEWLIQQAPTPSGAVIDWRPLEPWRRQVIAQAERSGIPNPCTGGTDPLHLSLHAGGPEEGSPGSVPLSVGTDVLFASNGLGWFTWLGQHCTRPMRVFTPDLGEVGTFGRSPWTDLIRLANVSEEWHQAGN